MPACEDAVRQFPNGARLMFQLGRAYQQANNFTAAVSQYRNATGANYAAAQSALGTMYLSGLGVPKDYQIALSSGIKRLLIKAMQQRQRSLGAL